MDWYEEWFGKEYLLVYPHRDEAEAREQIRFLKQHIHLPKGAKVLDLCCGCGRHAIELKKHGYDVIGLDLSSELLDQARSHASQRGLDVRFIRCDMREIPYENHFDLIANFFTSFGYFEDDSGNQKVLISIAKSLKPGGKFLIDYMNPDYVVRNLVERDEKDLMSPSALIPTEVGDPNLGSPSQALGSPRTRGSEQRGKTGAAAPSARRAEGLHIIQERWIDASTRRINKKITLIRNGKESTYRESVRMYSHREMRDMLLMAGLKLTETYGDFASSEYTQDSLRMILIGEK